MAGPNYEQCRKCYFFDAFIEPVEEQDKGYGFCHRYPPQGGKAAMSRVWDGRVVNNDRIPGDPEHVHIYDWCGEYKEHPYMEVSE